MLPEGIADLMNEKLDTEMENSEIGETLKQELDKFEKCVYIAYVPIDKIKITGF